MIVKDAENICIIVIEGNTISDTELTELEQFSKQKGLKIRIGIDLGNVKTVKAGFLEFLHRASLKKKVSIFNVNSDIYLMLFVMHYEQYTEIYLDERDFRMEKRNIVYRRLKILKAA
jgi:hypothetical protein